MSRLEKLQRTCFWLAIVTAGLGLTSASGCSAVEQLEPDLVWVVHPVLVALGTAAGIASLRRGAEIDRERWRIAEDPTVTSGEREYAHKNAERERRLAGIAFAGAPLMLGYWLAYQIESPADSIRAQLLPVSGIVGFVIGVLIGKWVERDDPNRDTTTPS